MMDNDDKGVTRSRKTRKERQYNSQKKGNTIAKRKRTKTNTMVHKHCTENEKLINTNTIQNRDELRYCGM
jgi:hypothetical protein